MLQIADNIFQNFSVFGRLYFLAQPSQRLAYAVKLAFLRV